MKLLYRLTGLAWYTAQILTNQIEQRHRRNTLTWNHNHHGAVTTRGRNEPPV